MPSETIEKNEASESAAALNTALSLRDLSNDQVKAYDAVLRWFKDKEWNHRTYEQVFTLGGLAGTGKTTLLGMLLKELVGKQGKAVAVLTPTGKASCVLARKLAGGTQPAFIGTIHSFMYVPLLSPKEELLGWSRRYFEKKPGSDTFVAKGGDIPKIDLLVIDESSMLNEETEDDIRAFGMPVLAVGDHGQLPPVQGKNTWMASPRVKLERIHRQAENNPIIALATYVREKGKLPPAANMLDIDIGYFKNMSDASDSLFAAYQARTLHEVAVITYTNALRCKINEQIQQHLYGTLEATTNTQLICLKNSKDAGLINGQRGFVQGEVQKHGPYFFSSVRFPDENFVYTGKYPRAQLGLGTTIPDTESASKLLEIPVKSMKDLGALFDYGYSLTAHKAQGSEFQEVFVAIQRGSQPNNYARWLYTAVTRASQKLHIMETFG